MQKIRLDLDALRVDSFETDAATGAHGTVHGHGKAPLQEPASDYNGVCNSYYDSCNGTCASCVNTCWASCNGTCNSCVAT